MSDERVLCQVCWAEGQQAGKPCWLCHNPVRVPDTSSNEEASKQEAFVATAVEPAPLDAIILEPNENNPYSSPRIVEESNFYGLHAVLLIVSVVIAAIVLCLTAPGLGVPVSIVVLPALVRTVVVSGRSRKFTKDLTAIEKVQTFFFSAAASAAAAIAGTAATAVAFFGACFLACLSMPIHRGAAFDSGPIPIIGTLACVVLGIGAGIYTFIHFTKQ